MSRGLPGWMRAGFRPNGPGLCVCPYCGRTVNTNALARAAHVRSLACREATEKRRPRIAQDTRPGAGDPSPDPQGSNRPQG